MLGYSLGGAVAFCLANRLDTKDLNGVIMLSPAIRENPFHAPYRKKFVAALAVIFKSFKLPGYSSRFGCKYKLD
jgi:pimeloyl-ACP methyl ester carboxylesterase